MEKLEYLKIIGLEIKVDFLFLWWIYLVLILKICLIFVIGNFQLKQLY